MTNPATLLADASPAVPISGANFVDDYLLALLAQASQLVSNEFHQVVTQHGLSVSEWRVMSSLAGGTAISIGGLALVSVTKQPTVTRLLERMIQKGHVERVTHSGDRRVNLVRITPQGQEMVAALMIEAKQHESRVFEPFGAERTEMLKAMLRDIIVQHRPG